MTAQVFRVNGESSVVWESAGGVNATQVCDFGGSGWSLHREEKWGASVD